MIGAYENTMGRQLLGLLVLDLEKSLVFWNDCTEICDLTPPFNMNGYIILIYPVIKWCSEMGWLLSHSLL